MGELEAEMGIAIFGRSSRGVTLTVTTNAVVKFMEGTGIKVEDGGRLNVVGAPGEDVIFTAANAGTAGASVPGVGPP